MKKLNKFVERIFNKYTPEKIIIYSRDEYKQFMMRQKFLKFDKKIRYFVGDVRDIGRLKRAFDGVDFVIHAAALKQVPVCEYNPFEAVKTNIHGAQNVIDAAIDKDVNFPEGSFVRFINDFIEKHIDIDIFKEKRKNDKIGAPAKHAKMMLKVIFYGLSLGIYSMRMIASKYIPYHLYFIYLSGYQTVDHSTLSRFINTYIKEIIEIFTRTLYISHNMGYVTKELVAIDGCKIKANASKKFTGSYKTFQKRKETYKKMIKNLMERLERVNAREIKGEVTKEEVEKENRG